MNTLRSVLPVAVKKVMWDLKYGALGYSMSLAPADAVAELLRNLHDATSILELGCGTGSLLTALRNAGWEGHYCGVDISPRAIKSAQKRSDQKSSWVVSDIETFRSPFRWDAVVLIESIYYINMRELPGVLGRIMASLQEYGILLVRLHDTHRHHEYVAEVQRILPTVEKRSDKVFCVQNSPNKSNSGSQLSTQSI